MTDNINDKIENLTPDQLESLGRLIDKFSRRNSNDQEEERKPRKNNKTKPQKGRSKPRSKIIIPGEENLEEEKEPIKRVVKNRKGRSEPRNSDLKTQKRERVRRPPGKGQKAGTTLARTESVSLSGENKFEKMRERNSHKKDSVIDKKLWGDNQPEQRPDEFSGFVEIECKSCELWYDVHPSEIYMDPDQGPSYTCDNCSKGPRG